VLGEVLQLWRAEATPVALPAPAPVAAPEAPKQEEAARTAAKVLKVEPARIDALMDLVGQLVVAKNSLPFLARRAEEEFGSGKLGRSIRDQYGVINRITEELQGAVMRVRMVPMSDVFRRFPRLVRDLSGKLDKRIRLDLSGEETEADKDVVQDLFDPLMHLMRNSIDHGLEGPEERERAGKPPEGTIRLGATQQEDQVVIELGDDGRGIDPEALKRKAVARGFLAADAAARMTDEEALQLIFLAGFSTAEQVTELSGRGVGMDVVRSMVARVGGKISLKSAPGRGTTTTISLPLTMAVSHVMVIEVGGSTFGIPFASIVETVRVPRGELRAIEGGEALVLRDRLVPICRLRRALGLETAGSTGDTEALVLARAGGEVVGFVIDEFHEAVDVIVKPLAGVLQHLPRFSGTALLGDGRPLLILDLEEVVR
jgi:two-component system chemotaxis sensor kinase CheA